MAEEETFLVLSSDVFKLQVVFTGVPDREVSADLRAALETDLASIRPSIEREANLGIPEA